MEDESARRLNFLMDAYKTRIQFFSDHANRTWTRFNILFTVELALSGLFFNTLFERGTSVSRLWLLPAFGIFISLFWYILGAQDRHAYLGYRDQRHSVEELVKSEVGASDLPRFNPLGSKKRSLLSWRSEQISLSKLLALFPIFFMLVWIVVVLIVLR